MRRSARAHHPLDRPLDAPRRRARWRIGLIGASTASVAVVLGLLIPLGLSLTGAPPGRSLSLPPSSPITSRSPLTPMIRELAPTDSIITTIHVGGGTWTPAYDKGSGRLYFANYYSYNVSIVSAGTNSVVATLPTGTGVPLGAVYDGDHGLVWVTDSSNNLTVISTASLQSVLSVGVGTNPAPATYVSATGSVYVSNQNSNTVSVVAGDSGSVVATVPVGTYPETPTYDPANGELYVANFVSNNVSVLSVSTNRVIATVPVGGAPNAPVVDTLNGDVFVPNQSDNTVSVISGSSNQVVATVRVGPGPHVPLFVAETGNVYVPNYYASNVTVISGSSNSVVATIPVGANPQTPAWDSANGELYVPNAGTSNLSVVSGATNTVLRNIPVGLGPTTPFFDPDNGLVYAPSFRDGIVDVIAGGSKVTFSETGLAPGSGWGGTFAGQPFSSTATTLSLDVLPGAYSYQIAPLAGYSVAPSSGTATVGSRSYSVPVAFTQTTYPVSVNVGGLPLGTVWDATIQGVLHSATTSSLTLELPNGTYSYDFSSVTGYTLTGGTGSFVVTGAAVSIGATYTTIPATYSIAINQTGLPSGIRWSAILGGIEESSSTSSIVFSVPAGTYAYQILPVAGFTASPQSGTASIAGGYLIAVEFSPISTGTATGSSQVSVVGYSEGFTIAIAVAATALGLGLATLLALRRRPPPDSGGAGRGPGDPAGIPRSPP